MCIGQSDSSRQLIDRSPNILSADDALDLSSLRRVVIVSSIIMSRFNDKWSERKKIRSPRYYLARREIAIIMDVQFSMCSFNLSRLRSAVCIRFSSDVWIDRFIYLRNAIRSVDIC